MKNKGRFGDFGGFYVPEVLIPALEEIEEASQVEETEEASQAEETEEASQVEEEDKE